MSFRALLVCRAAWLLALALICLTACASTPPPVETKPIRIYGNDGVRWIRPGCPFVVIAESEASLSEIDKSAGPEQLRKLQRRARQTSTDAVPDMMTGQRNAPVEGLNYREYTGHLDKARLDDPEVYATLLPRLQEKARLLGGDALVNLRRVREPGGRLVAVKADVVRFTDPDCVDPPTGTAAGSAGR